MASFNNFFVSGGTLNAHAPSYVPRAADDQLFDALIQGEFCYVLNARQMGKSSLMVRTATALRDARVGVVIIDLTQIGRNVTPEQWYYGMLVSVGQQLNCLRSLQAEWTRTETLGPVQRWSRVLELAVVESERPIVIFIDEIDFVRSLPFNTDELFSTIRECYNRRAEEPFLKQLSFCLLGVATPAELVQDQRTTPFNIGRKIELEDFTLPQVMALASNMAESWMKRESKRSRDIKIAMPPLLKKLAAGFWILPLLGLFLGGPQAIRKPLQQFQKLFGLLLVAVFLAALLGWLYSLSKAVKEGARGWWHHPRELTKLMVWLSLTLSAAIFGLYFGRVVGAYAVTSISSILVAVLAGPMLLCGIQLYRLYRMDTAVLQLHNGAVISASRYARMIIREIYYWTSGHPYLTQRLCLALANAPEPRDSTTVDQVCRRIFLKPDAFESDDNLANVQRRMLSVVGDRVALLQLYDEILRGGRPADDYGNWLHSSLKLSGIVRVHKGRLEPRNRIYRAVMDRKWIRANLASAEVWKHKIALQRNWERAAIVSISALIIVAIVVARPDLRTRPFPTLDQLNRRIDDLERENLSLRSSQVAVTPSTKTSSESALLDSGSTEADLANARREAEAARTNLASAKRQLALLRAAGSKSYAKLGETIQLYGSARKRAYRSDMQRVASEIRSGNIKTALKLLESYRPKHSKPLLASIGTIPTSDSAESAESDLRDWEWRYWWSELNTETLRSPKITGNPSALTVTGKSILVHEPAAILRYSADQLQPTGEIVPDRGFRFLTVSPTGTSIALLSPRDQSEKLIGIISLQQPNLKLLGALHGEPTMPATFSSSGAQIIVRTTSGVDVFDTERLVTYFHNDQLEPSKPHDLEISPNGTYISALSSDAVAANQSFSVRVWNARENRELRLPQLRDIEKEASAMDCTFSNDEKKLAIAWASPTGSNSKVRVRTALLTLERGPVLVLQDQLIKTTKPVRLEVAFNADDKWLKVVTPAGMLLSDNSANDRAFFEEVEDFGGDDFGRQIALVQSDNGLAKIALEPSFRLTPISPSKAIDACLSRDERVIYALDGRGLARYNADNRSPSLLNPGGRIALASKGRYWLWAESGIYRRSIFTNDEIKIAQGSPVEEILLSPDERWLIAKKKSADAMDAYVGLDVARRQLKEVPSLSAFVGTRRGWAFDPASECLYLQYASELPVVFSLKRWSFDFAPPPDSQTAEPGPVDVSTQIGGDTFAAPAKAGVAIYDAASMKQLRTVRTYGLGQANPSRLSISSDGRLISAVPADGRSMTVFKSDTGQMVLNGEDRTNGFLDPPYLFADSFLIFNRLGRWARLHKLDGVPEWDIEDVEAIVGFVPGTSRILVERHSGFQLVDVESGDAVLTLPGTAGHTCQISPDGLAIVDFTTGRVHAAPPLDAIDGSPSSITAKSKGTRNLK